VIKHWLDGVVFSPASGTSIILNTSLDSDTVRWRSSYTITVMEQYYIFLYQWCVRISLISTHVISKCSLLTIIVAAYIYFNIFGCYYFSSIFAHRLGVLRSAKRSAVGLDALQCEQCSSFVNNSPAFSIHRSSTTLQSSTIPDASIHWSRSNTTPRLHTFLIYVHRPAVWPFAHCTVQWLRLRLALHRCNARRSSTTTSRNISTLVRLRSCVLVISLL